MVSLPFAHLNDEVLMQRLGELVTRDRRINAAFLACLGEVDARRLYLPAAYPSTYLFCIHELRLAEEAAYKRIRAARAARRFPSLLAAVDQGRLHLSAIALLAPYLNDKTAAELIADATHKSRAEVEILLARRFPRTEFMPMVEISPPATSLTPIVTPPPAAALTVAAMPIPAAGIDARPRNMAPGEAARGDAHAPPAPHPPPAQVPGQARPASPQWTPLAPERYALHISFGREFQDKLTQARELLGHQVDPGDLTGLLERALDALIVRLERGKFAATDRPQGAPRPTLDARHVPAHVKRAVWARDGGRCTFVSADGVRCAARSGLEFDHAHPVARGGESTVDNVRLRCHAHNQYAAEIEFGREFMERKRSETPPAGPPPDAA